MPNTISLIDAKLVTSNIGKLKEFQEMIGSKLSLAQGIDLREVDADPLICSPLQIKGRRKGAYY